MRTQPLISCYIFSIFCNIGFYYIICNRFKMQDSNKVQDPFPIIEKLQNLKGPFHEIYFRPLFFFFKRRYSYMGHIWTVLRTFLLDFTFEVSKICRRCRHCHCRVCVVIEYAVTVSAYRSRWIRGHGVSVVVVYVDTCFCKKNI